MGRSTEPLKSTIPKSKHKKKIIDTLFDVNFSLRCSSKQKHYRKKKKKSRKMDEKKN